MDRCQKCGCLLSGSADSATLCAKCEKEKRDQDVIRVLRAIVSVPIVEPTCKWRFDRYDHRAVLTPIWKTECEREFDRLRGSEQPRKHLNMEFCPFCGGTIIDETQDC